MYSPSPPAVTAGANPYVYLNHHQTMPSGQFASRAQPSAVSAMGVAPSATGNSAAPAYGHSPAMAPLGATRFGSGASVGWMSRQPQQPQTQQASHFVPHYGTPPMSSLPHSMNHHNVLANIAPSSPSYTNLGSPHTAAFVRSSVSPVAPTQPSTTSNSSSNIANASPEWLQQMMCAEISRQSFAPHHHARAAALAARSSANHGQDPKKGIVLPAGVVANGLSFPMKGSDSTAQSADSSLSMSPTKSSSMRTQEADPKDSDKSWSIMDMGGLKLKNIGVDIFRYTFLTSLFINHNNLTTLSPAILQLRNLSVLDASGNQLVAIPPEIGMLTSLSALFLFDNQLTILPPEIGTLYQLEMLGIEGNPLQPNLYEIIKQEGTQALVAYLRDSCPVPVPPPEREWISLDMDLPPMSAEEDEAFTFAVLSYNILCEKYATAQMYGYTPSWALAWDYRKECILQELVSYNAEFFCLQEVEMGQFYDYFEPKLNQHGYEGIYWPKSRARTMRDDERQHVDGCATFFKTDTFELVDKHLIEFNQIALQRPDFKKTQDIFNRVMTKDNVACIGMLEHRKAGYKIIVANAHMHWNPEFRDVKLVQAAMLMEQLEMLGNQFAKRPSQVKCHENFKPPNYTSGQQIPTLVCGDFNSTPDSGVYEFLNKGSAPGNHEDFMDHVYGTYTSEGLKHNYALRSAYSNIGEMPFTNLTPGFQGNIDYIWYTSNTLAASCLLGEVDSTYLSRVVGFPNAHFPSDHVCILGEFKVKRLGIEATS